MKYFIKRIDNSANPEANEYPWKLYIVFPENPNVGVFQVHGRTYQDIKKAKITLSGGAFVRRGFLGVGYEPFDLTPVSK